MIRKLGKARWTYSCVPCDLSLNFPDQFRAIEAMQKHQRGFGHFGASLGSALTSAFAPLFAAFGYGYAAKAAAERESAAVTARYAPFPEGKSALDALQAMSFAKIPPPPNLPHDPSLLKNRRRWGGR